MSPRTSPSAAAGLQEFGHLVVELAARFPADVVGVRVAAHAQQQGSIQEVPRWFLDAPRTTYCGAPPHAPRARAPLHEDAEEAVQGPAHGRGAAAPPCP